MKRSKGSGAADYEWLLRENAVVQLSALGVWVRISNNSGFREPDQ